MLTKIDVRKIVSEHIRTLVNVTTNKKTGDIALFYGFPLFLALVLLKNCNTINDNTANALITALSIFAGLLFNLLLLVHGIIKSTDGSERGKLQRLLLKETYANISYSILVTITALIILLIRFISINPLIRSVITLLTYFLTANFILTLLMVLKRLQILLDKEFD